MRLYVCAALSAVAFACGPDRSFIALDATPALDPSGVPDSPGAPTPPPADSDGDGLLDLDEQALGTDPALPDSDGDGWTDAEEAGIEHTDPTDPNDRPYLGGWRIGACRDDVVGAGQAVGQVAHDFGLVDQFGDTLHLHDFCDRAVLLVSSADWCGSCQAEAPILQDWYEAWAADGFMVITLLGEGDNGSWADAFGLDHPVVRDPGYDITGRFVGSGSFYLPSMHLLGPGAVVITREDWVSESDVTSALP
jgi:thiol-disulfide isomerase/thioredoxin